MVCCFVLFCFVLFCFVFVCLFVCLFVFFVVVLFVFCFAWFGLLVCLLYLGFDLEKIVHLQDIQKLKLL